MLKISFITITAVLFLMACDGHKAEVQESQIAESIKVSDTIMNNKDTVKTEVIESVDTRLEVSGKVVFSNSICGGNIPSDEMQAKNDNSKVPLINSTILLKDKKNKKNTFKITTDKKGNFKTLIEPGNYGFYMTESYDKEMECSFSSLCEVWLKQKFGEINFKKDKSKGYEIYYAFQCNPCIQAVP